MLLAQCFIRRLRALRLRAHARAPLDARGACLTAQRVLRAAAGAARRAAAAGASARGGSSRSRVRGVPLSRRIASSRDCYHRNSRRRQASARVFCGGPGHEAGEAPGAAARAVAPWCTVAARDARVPDAFPVARARATRWRDARAAWRAVFQKRRRDDAIRAFQRRGGGLLRLLAKRGYSSSSSSTPPFPTTIMRRRHARCRRGGALNVKCGPRADGVDGRFVCRVY